MYLIALLAITTLCAILGQGLLYLWKVRLAQPYKVLTGLVLGLLAAVTLYSIFITKGKTVQLGFLWIGILAWLVLKQEGKIEKDRQSLCLANSRDWWQYAFFVGILGGWFLYFYSVFQIYTHGQTGCLSLIYEDMIFYAKVGEWISQSGQENPLGSAFVLDDSFKGMTPYHYFELYFGQMLADIFQLNALKTHIYITNTFSVGLISYAIAVFAKQILGEQSTKIVLWGSLLAVCYSGVKLPISLSQAGHYTIHLLEVNTIKFAFLFLFFLLGTYLALQRNNLFVLPFLVIPMMSYTLFPAVLFALSVLGFCAYFYYYKHAKSLQLLHIYTIGGIVSFIFLFKIYDYWGLPNTYQLVPLNFSFLWEQQLQNWQTSLNILIGTPIYFLLDYILYILILGSFWWFWGQPFSIKKIPLQLIVIPLLFLGAILTWIILRFTTQESFQTPAIITGLVGNLAIIFSTILVYKNIKKQHGLFLTIQAGILLYLIYGTLFYNGRTYNRVRSGVVEWRCIAEIIPYIPDDKARIATLDNTLRRHEVYPFGDWLIYFKQKTMLTSISPVLLTDEYDVQAQIVDNAIKALRISTPFYRYVEWLKKQKKFINIQSAQLSFLQEYDFKYVLVEPSFVDTTGVLLGLEKVVDCSAGGVYKTKNS